MPKLVIKNDMMKENSVKADFVTPEGYYRFLKKKEKTMFLEYLAIHYGMKVNTTRNKLLGNNNQELNTIERMVVNDVIKNELWKEPNSTATPTDACISGRTDMSRRD